LLIVNKKACCCCSRLWSTLATEKLHQCFGKRLKIIWKFQFQYHQCQYLYQYRQCQFQFQYRQYLYRYQFQYLCQFRYR
jgi:hypothetical protein